VKIKTITSSPIFMDDTKDSSVKLRKSY